MPPKKKIQPLTKEQLSRWAAYVGSHTSDRKARTSAANGKLGGRPRKPLGDIESRVVLASEYVRPFIGRMTHAVEVDGRHAAVRVLCGRIKLALLDARSASDPFAPPTCAICRRHLAAPR